MAPHPSPGGPLRGRKGRPVNVIDSYLDTLFAPYPDTPRLRERGPSCADDGGPADGLEEASLNPRPSGA